MTDTPESVLIVILVEELCSTGAVVREPLTCIVLAVMRALTRSVTSS